MEFNNRSVLECLIRVARIQCDNVVYSAQNTNPFYINALIYQINALTLTYD
jgi:hypothetical protein